MTNATQTDSSARAPRLARALEGAGHLPVTCAKCQRSFWYKVSDGGAVVECPQCKSDVKLPPLDKQDVIIALLLRDESAPLAAINQKLTVLITNVSIAAALILLALLALFFR